MTKKTILAATVAATLMIALPAAADGDYRAKAIATFHKDFQPRGQASIDRLAEDGLQMICNRTNNKPPEYIAKRLEADQLAEVKYPADGKLMGDWKKGEKLFASGFAMRIGAIEPDKPEKQKGGNGGNCYACHAADPKEVAAGTIKGSVNIPMNELEKKIASLPTDKPVVFVCGTGARSGEAYDTVKLLGGKVQASFLDADVKFNADGTYAMTAKK